MAEVLNDKQVRVLQWIADGCADGIMHGESHKLSAAALKSRGARPHVGTRTPLACRNHRARALLARKSIRPEACTPANATSRARGRIVSRTRVSQRELAAQDRGARRRRDRRGRGPDPAGRDGWRRCRVSTARLRRSTSRQGSRRQASNGRASRWHLHDLLVEGRPVTSSVPTTCECPHG